MAKVKVNMSLDSDLISRIDDYAAENYMTRSSVITLATSMFLNEKEATKAIVSMSLAMRKIADDGKIDEATAKQLEDIERLAKLLSGQ